MSSPRYPRPAFRSADLVWRNALTWVLPRLLHVAPEYRDEALRQARAADFDALERVGVLMALALTTWLLRSDVGASEIAPPIRFIAQFCAAFLLLVVLSGPFYLRRLRRGLDHAIERRQRAD